MRHFFTIDLRNNLIGVTDRYPTTPRNGFMTAASWMGVPWLAELPLLPVVCHQPSETPACFYNLLNDDVSIRWFLLRMLTRESVISRTSKLSALSCVLDNLHIEIRHDDSSKTTTI